MIIFRVQNGKVTAEVSGVTGPVCEAKLQELLRQAGLRPDGDMNRKSEFYQEESVHAEVKVV